MSDGPSGDHRDSGETHLPRTERPDPPLYLARYLQRRQNPDRMDTRFDADATVPLYLRRFRQRRQGLTIDVPPPRLEGEHSEWVREWADITRSKEIVAPPSAHHRVVATIHIIRHGETQGYSADGGLTPLGSWQANRRGHDLSKAVRDGERVRIVCADTNRARQTADQILRGMNDGLVLWNRQADIKGPEPMEEFRNFRVATPDGIKDVTSAFRLYQSVMERYERIALGDRPMWLVEIDRFWKTQEGGGDPIHHWMTIPMLHFEPPASTVRRFWAGFTRLVAESESGTRIICATHSGPMRAFAAWAVGYDPGEPYNTEEVVVKVREGAHLATVAYRNRIQDVHVPSETELSNWTLADEEDLR